MKKTIFVALLLLFCSVAVDAQSKYQPASVNLAARKTFEDNKFGVFIHWGLYSMMADGEWNMNNKNLNYREYGKLASGFYPSKFDASAWVSAIKASGAKYICFTTRHHEGFSMFDTKYSDYNIMDATPFKRDIVKELADECHKQGIKIHFYYSHLDWYRDDYPIGRTGQGTGRILRPNWPAYYRFMNNQLTELLTNYGEVGAIWFDGYWDQDQNKDFNWELEKQYALIHSLQPGCLVANNHHVSPFPGEDIQLFERDLPGENKAGLSGQEVSHLPLETCETLNGSWGYNMRDTSYKSIKTFVQLLVKAAGKGANLLMNVGPQPNGELPAVALERLSQMGEWMDTYGPTIYGTRGGIIKPQEWGVTTQKEKTLYVHILYLKDKELFLPVTGNKLRKAVVFKDQKKVNVYQDEKGIKLFLGEVPTDDDYVIELTFAKILQ